MLKEIHSWYSPNLEKNINIAVYGHYGFSVLLFPAKTDDYLECENEGLIDSISHILKIGSCRVFAIEGIMNESWLNSELTPEESSEKQYQYNRFVEDEVVPFIYQNCSGAIPIITCGASNGAYLAANAYFRRPDLFLGTIAMSGFFNIEFLTKGFFDENCYFNSPIHYLPNLNDAYWMSFLRSRKHVYIASGAGPDESPWNSSQISDILNSKDIRNELDIWDESWGHNWETWNKMFNKFISYRF